MDVIITTGFEKIKYSTDFNPQGLSNGENLVKSGHVCLVQEFRINGVSHKIQAHVIRQTCVTDRPYKVELFVSILQIYINFILICALIISFHSCFRALEDSLFTCLVEIIQLT